MLHRIQRDVEARAREIAAARGDWPCRKGCADCCRSLAAEPRVSREEWIGIERALAALPLEVAEAARRRIREGAGPGRSKARPVVCPLLDRETDACLVYEARPVACRAYGFYAEREAVLGCGRIEKISREREEVVWGGTVWGNHAALEQRMEGLGEARELSAWLDLRRPRCGGASVGRCRALVR